MGGLSYSSRGGIPKTAIQTEIMMRNQGLGGTQFLDTHIVISFEPNRPLPELPHLRTPKLQHRTQPMDWDEYCHILGFLWVNHNIYRPEVLWP